MRTAIAHVPSNNLTQILRICTTAYEASISMEKKTPGTKVITTHEIFVNKPRKGLEAYTIVIKRDIYENYEYDKLIKEQEEPLCLI